MCALAAALASLALLAPAPGTRLDVRWIVGPASVELDGGRVTCVLPAGLALAPGTATRPILEAVAEGPDGTELAVVSPTAPSRTWFVVLAWRGAASAEAAPEVAGPVRDGEVVWLERPRRDERSGALRWSFAGRAPEGPIVNQHVRIPASGGAVELTLVAPVEQLGEARVLLGRIVEGLELDAPPPTRRP